MSVDKGRIEKAVREILEAIGEDPDRDGLVRTPARMADMYEEIFSGLHNDPSEHLTVTFEADHDEMVMVRDIPVHSLCVPSKERINTPRGVKQARNIEVGDVLWTLNDAGDLVTTHVMSVGWRKTKTIVEVRAGKHRLRVTPEHPIYTTDGWIEAGDLVSGMKVRAMEARRLCRDIDWVEIDSVETITTTGSKPYTVYSFECWPNPSFLVSGVLTHNCEHHLVPFAGRAHVAYIPGDDGRITGLSKIARLVDGFAHRPQVQERLTTQIADALQTVLKPDGVFVVIEAEHLCMSMRGVKKPGSLTITSAVRGLFKTNPATRAEAMSLITHPGNRL